MSTQTQDAAATTPDLPWWEWSANVVYLAEDLLARHASAQTIFDVFMFPWEFTDEYKRAVAAGVEHVVRVLPSGPDLN